MSEIELGDTVRLTGRRGRGVVTGLRPGQVEITYTFNRRNGYEESTCWYAAGRVELVRKGNVDDDRANAMLAVLDRIDAERAALLGETLEQYRARIEQERQREAEAAEAASAVVRAGELARRRRAAELQERQAEAERAALERAEADRVEAEHGAAELAAHRELHGGDVLEALMCGAGVGICPGASYGQR